jgi:hypothetical protein
MKETQLLGTLLPSHPDFIPILQAIREKYNLPEISPDDDPITEIYLGDESIPLEEFRQDIENRIQENITSLSPDTTKFYKSSKIRPLNQPARIFSTPTNAPAKSGTRAGSGSSPR